MADTQQHSRMEDFEALEKDLRRHILFTGLTEEQMGRVRHNISMVSLETGDHLFEQGQQAERFFLVCSGQIKLYRLSASGNEKVIEIIRPGQTFAEAVMFMDIQNYPVNAEALAPSEIVAVNNRAFLAILGESVETCFRVMADMSIRLRRRLNEIDALTLQNATLRLVNYLLYEIPEGSDQSAECARQEPKSIIASRLSVQPETHSRILHNLADAGLISVKGLNIEVHDIAGLRAWAQ